MAEKTLEHYEGIFKKTRGDFSALAERIRNGDIDSFDVGSVQVVRESVLMECQFAEKGYRAYFQKGGDNNNNDYIQLGALGTDILNELQSMIDTKIGDLFGEN